MHRSLAAVLVIAAFVLLSDAGTAARADRKAAREFHERACASYPRSSSPWHVTNLYDCKTRKLYVPYQLWSGAKWDGRKGGSCMHEADSAFDVNGFSRTTIRGPEAWRNPGTGKKYTVWVRAKVNGSKVQHFTCHGKGIGRVYDSRGPRYYTPGRCKFPAGHGWKVGKRRSCKTTAIEIINVALDKGGHLTSLVFKWWARGKLDHIYRYEPEYGSTNAWKQ